MASKNPLFFLITSAAYLSVSICIFLANPVFSECKNPPILFNFGDSNSDTGGLVAGLGYQVNFPNGRTFFNKSTGRLSDGRLIIDFLCLSVKTRFLNPYLDAIGSTFTNGANFAIVGSRTLPKYVPFSLNIQVMQFLHFKSRSTELVTSGSKRLINDDGFRNALYMIDIGQNDLSDSFAKKLSYGQVFKKIPSVIVEIKNSIKVIYEHGGRKFWVHNTGPLGCLPQKLSQVQRNSGFDSVGCISSYNQAAQFFNEALRHLCQELRSEMKDAVIVYVDIYSIKYDIIGNATRYGVSNPLMTCCGYGGPPYNYNIKIPCGQPGTQVCKEGSRAIMWDGIHYTDAANALIASKILSMDYSTPLSSIGISKESQLRAAKIFGVTSEGSQTAHVTSNMPNFFKYAQDLITQP